MKQTAGILHAADKNTLRSEQFEYTKHKDCGGCENTSAAYR